MIAINSFLKQVLSSHHLLLFLWSQQPMILRTKIHNQVLSLVSSHLHPKGWLLILVFFMLNFGIIQSFIELLQSEPFIVQLYMIVIIIIIISSSSSTTTTEEAINNIVITDTKTAKCGIIIVIRATMCCLLTFRFLPQ